MGQVQARKNSCEKMQGVHPHASLRISQKSSLHAPLLQQGLHGIPRFLSQLWIVELWQRRLDKLARWH